MSVKIYIGDALQRLKELPDNSVDCCVTSPPYWGLRDYGVKGQLGLERTPEEHIAALVKVFREVYRVLKPEGTLWVNYGDTYATHISGRPAAEVVNDDRTFRDKPFSTVVGKLKPKDLVGLPWLLAFALRDELGFYLRSDIIWHKPNSMPESAKDRPAKAHEYMFLFSKSQKYFYNYKAALEPVAANDNGNIQHPNALRFDRIVNEPERPGIMTASTDYHAVKEIIRVFAAAVPMFTIRVFRMDWGIPAVKLSVIRKIRQACGIGVRYGRLQAVVLPRRILRRFRRSWCGRVCWRAALTVAWF